MEKNKYLKELEAKVKELEKENEELKAWREYIMQPSRKLEIRNIFDGIRLIKKEVFVRDWDEENLYEATWKIGEGLFVKGKGDDIIREELFLEDDKYFSWAVEKYIYSHLSDEEKKEVSVFLK